VRTSRGQREEVEARRGNIQILLCFGAVESDILGDGSLDYPTLS